MVSDARNWSPQLQDVYLTFITRSHNLGSPGRDLAVQRKAARMLILAVIIFIPLLLVLSGAQALVESIDPDELTSMGVVTQP
jgi:hypothetical protein